MKRTRHFFSLLALAAVPVALGADEKLFTEKVRPVLAERCFKCHSHESGKSKGGLMLDSRAAILAGGDDGAVIVPGKPEEGLLLKAIRQEDEDTKMPPKGEKLKAEEIAAITEWIKQGAVWPGEDTGKTAKPVRGKITEEDRQWWAFQPLKIVAPPPSETGNPIDAFILARLEKEGLAPAPEAARTALVRRVTFDLTGLPPTPEEVAAFANDHAADAYEKLTDRLLASPRYGERMARAWLDLVRYADGDGYRADDYRPTAWHYRDYVIRALNADKPYDRIVREQLAGDDLFPGDPEALIATGYLRHGIYEWNARDVRGQWDIILNDLTDTTGDVFLGLGVQCARCHDHKFDPILQKDYFRLRAFFAGIQPGDRVAATAAETSAHAEKMRPWEEKTAALRAELATLEQLYFDKAERTAIARFPDDIQAMIRKPAAQREPLEAQFAVLAWRQVEVDWARRDGLFSPDDKERILALRRQLAAFDAEKPAPLPVAFACGEVGPEAAPVLMPKKEALGAIEPGFLTLLDPEPAKVAPQPRSTGRRSALATWLTQPENPLTARVVVNRAWQQHFGRGLAAQASDFGKLGEKPVNPELLDWLAGWFVRDGWSLKKLHRLIVTSGAYRRAAQHPAPEAGRLKDPENRLLWRWTPRRLEAEQIRDAMLAVSGALEACDGGEGVTSDVPRRTIYTRVMRNTREPLADVFDAPQWIASASSRDTTTTPVQSLLLANSALLRTRGRGFAERLEKLAPTDLAAQVRAASRLALGRTATEPEGAAATEFIRKETALADLRRLGSGQAAFVPDKVPYRDGQAAFLEPDGGQTMFRVSDSAALVPDGAFTIEAFVVPRSVSHAAELRTIAAKWDGNRAGAGWALGITGQKSRRKPLSIALQLIGEKRDGTRGEQPVFADLGVQMNKPYFIAAAFTPATATAPGSVFFALKDLSNDDEPLLTATVPHDITGGLASAAPLTIGARSGSPPQSFHGALDDVRISRTALAAAQMLYGTESLADTTLGYWTFEAKPDVFGDQSGHGHALERPAPRTETPLTPAQAALAGFCHALLNSSEFLYTE